MPGHLVGWESVRDMERLEEDYYGEFTDAGMSEIRSRYDVILSKEECDFLSSVLSGDIVIKVR